MSTEYGAQCRSSFLVLEFRWIPKWLRAQAWRFEQQILFQQLLGSLRARRVSQPLPWPQLLFVRRTQPFSRRSGPVMFVFAVNSLGFRDVDLEVPADLSKVPGSFGKEKTLSQSSRIFQSLL